MSTREIWRLVPSMPGLLASSHGRIMVAHLIADRPATTERHYAKFAAEDMREVANG